MPEPLYFISYSPVDGEETALGLADKLAMGPPSIPTWLDQRKLQPGIDRYKQTVEALRECTGLLYIMTRGSVDPDCECTQEWTRALKYKKPIIPLLFDDAAELPYRLEPREPIKFAKSFDAGLGRLRDYVRSRATPEGALQTLKERLQDARRDLAHADTAEKARIEDEIAELERQIAEQQQAIDNPQAAQQRTEKSIQARLERGAASRQTRRRRNRTPASSIGRR